MIGNRAEYEKMHLLEGKLWWYKTLHGKVLREIRANFGNNLNIKILDAGCGTGGMLSFLKSNGYNNISGFDISTDAVDFCREKGISVSELDIRKLNEFKAPSKFDVIICNDMLYFLSDEEIIKTLKIFRQMLDNQGVIVLNIHAFEVFSGSHDVAVGSNRRFRVSDFKQYITAAGADLAFFTYWSFFLSPLILGVRLLQNFKLKIGLLKGSEVESDVEYPGDFVNNTLLKIVKIEEKTLKKAPFGSSLFMIIR